MAIGDGSFRSRAASLIPHAQQSVRRSLRRGSNAEKPVFSPKAHQADRLNDESAPLSGLEPTQTHTSSGDTQHTSGSDAVAHDREARRVVRTIPRTLAASGRKTYLRACLEEAADQLISLQHGCRFSVRTTKICNRRKARLFQHHRT